MTILLYVVSLVISAVVVLLIVASFRPGTFKYERSLVMAAPAATVYAHVADFKKWQAWSPWEKLDASMTKSYSGSPTGVGAAYAWEGNGKVGAGKMTITHATPPGDLDIALEFLRPFKASNHTKFTFVEAAGATTVTWGMDGKVILMSKVMGLFMNMEAMICADFERGLAALKGVVEAEAGQA